MPVTPDALATYLRDLADRIESGQLLIDKSEIRQQLVEKQDFPPSSYMEYTSAGVFTLTLELRHPTQVVDCPWCGGTGGERGECGNCNGTGQLRRSSTGEYSFV